MNRLLERQIKKYLVNIDPKCINEMQGFFRAISDAYDADEVDRKLMERSVEISSKEIVGLNQQEQKEANANKEAITILQDAVTKSLGQNTYFEHVSHSEHTQEVIRLAHFLSDMVIKYQKNVDELTTQKNHSDILSHELQIFKLAADNAADLITFFDENMKFIYANKVAGADTGFGDVIGKTISEVGAKITSQDSLNNFIKHINAGEDQFVSDMDIAGPQGQTAIFQTNTTIVRDTRMKKIGVNISRDITKERFLKSEKDEFISIASHELRTPMTAIRGFISILNQQHIGPINNEQKEIIDKISRNTKTLIDLVNDMLNLSKIEANKLDLQISENPIDSLVNKAIEKIQILYDSKGIALEYSGDTTKVITDPDKFERIMLNLLGNAYKFTQTGGNVTVSSTVNEGERLATICVADTGAGIPQASLGNLFKKFYQVDNVLTRQTGGTGLGLSICKGLVELLGGTIWVESTPGEGSKFFFTMPMSGSQ